MATSLVGPLWSGKGVSKPLQNALLFICEAAIVVYLFRTHIFPAQNLPEIKHHCPDMFLLGTGNEILHLCAIQAFKSVSHLSCGCCHNSGKMIQAPQRVVFRAPGKFGQVQESLRVLGIGAP